MITLLYALSILGAVIGALVGIFAIGGANGAPQEAAGGAIALCWAIIPYCLARAVHEHRRAAREAKQTDMPVLKVSPGSVEDSKG